MNPLFALPVEEEKPKPRVKLWGNVTVHDVEENDKQFIVKFSVIYKRKTLKGTSPVPYWTHARVWVTYEHTTDVPLYIQDELKTATESWLQKWKPDLYKLIDEELGF